jgi:signal transduction histidine kinase
MNPTEVDRDLESLTLGSSIELQELVDREALGEMVRSFQALFGISLRIYSEEGKLLADASSDQAICQYVNTLRDGRSACAKTVSHVKSLGPGDGGADGGADVSHPCFTGAVYRIFPIVYESRQLGKAILGPYLPAHVVEVPKSLLDVDSSFEAARGRDLLARMPRAKTETITLISDHLRRTLDLILFSGHKALLTSQMHLSSVRVSYRELEDKTQKLQEAFDRLRELDRLKSNFLGTVSHELRTPLTSIIGYSEMLAEGIAGPLGDEQREFVQTIREKGEQLLQLILGLLDLSKLESGTMSLRKASVKMAKVLDDVVSTITPRARKRGVLLKCVTPDALPDLIGDAERLRQVFINLTDNAVKFSPEGGTVELSASAVLADAPVDDDGEGEGLVLLAPSRRAVEVRIADHGIGIPEAERVKIFDPFYQVDSSSTREYGGTGLGLSIVKRLVEAHGGTVRASANEPKGSVFIVTLPLESPRPPR